LGGVAEGKGGRREVGDQFCFAREYISWVGPVDMMGCAKEELGGSC
jgi:hypothetical protein